MGIPASRELRNGANSVGSSPELAPELLSRKIEALSRFGRFAPVRVLKEDVGFAALVSVIEDMIRATHSY